MILKLRQDQWDWIFDYAFTLLLAVGYAAIIWWMGASWWLAAFMIHHEVFVWKRRFPPAVSRPTRDGSDESRGGQ